MLHIHNNLAVIGRWCLAIICMSIFCGLSVSVFLYALDSVTSFRQAHKYCYFLLPIIGLVIAAIYIKWGKNIDNESSKVVQALYEPDKKIPLALAPIILVSTLFTHLAGGSAGREGAATQMGASLAQTLEKLFIYPNAHVKKTLVMMGISGGFAAVFGTPYAGAIFAMEVAFNKHNLKSIVQIILTAFLSNKICIYLQIKHTAYNIKYYPELNFSNILNCCIVGIIMGLCAKAFIFLIKNGKLYANIFSSNLFIKTGLGGLFILAFLYVVGKDIYCGLGIETISSYFIHSGNLLDVVLKIVFTVLTLSFGFKGGEVTPLFFIGAALGSFLFCVIPLPLSLIAGLGFISVFAAASNTPFACSIMAIEMFEFKMFPFALLTCLVAYIFSGNNSIYSTQKTNKYFLLNKFLRL